MNINSTPQLLEAASLAINNTMKEADKQKVMANYGFSPKRMQEGKDLLDKTQVLHEVKDQHYDERWELSNQIETKLAVAHQNFAEHVKIARFVFRNEPTILYKLRINRISHGVWARTRQAKDFYTKVIPYAAMMEPQGVSLATLTEAKAFVEGIITMKEERTRKKGEAENTTDSKNQSIKMLRAWLTEFRAAARLAFKDTPQKLESLGISVPSKK